MARPFCFFPIAIILFPAPAQCRYGATSMLTGVRTCSSQSYSQVQTMQENKSPDSMEPRPGGLVGNGLIRVRRGSLDGCIGGMQRLGLILRALESETNAGQLDGEGSVTWGASAGRASRKSYVSSRERLILRLSLILQRAFCSSDTESVQKS